MIEPEGGKIFDTQECRLGIDEAGRGPVLGHMVYACCYWPAQHEIDNPDKYKAFVDSKKTSEAKREEIYNSMEEARLNGELNFKYYPLDPVLLSNDLLGNVRNLNHVSHDTAIALIEAALAEGNNIKEVYVDTVGPPQKYQQKLSDHFSGKGITFRVESKADDKFKCVSAASIVAKVQRDNMLKNWEFIEPMFKDDAKQFG